MRLIITADWHLRFTRPVCRNDKNWIDTQKKALRQIEDYAYRNKADVMVVGDIFHTSMDTNFECIRMVQDMAIRLSERDLGLFILCGNHDLPYHSSKNIDKSAVGVLLNSNNIFPIESYSFDFSAKNFDEKNEDKEFVFIHTLAFKDKKSMPPMIIGGTTADELKKRYPNAKWIFLGDNHHSWQRDINGTHILNPGCIIRQVSDMKDYECGVFYVDTDIDRISFLPITDDVELVDTSYIEERDERIEEIERFTERLKKNEDLTFDFEDNIRKALLSVGDLNIKRLVEKFVGIT
jgi:DNA repair exonuclease SbcCD nuclease subunit